MVLLLWMQSTEHPTSEEQATQTIANSVVHADNKLNAN